MRQRELYMKVDHAHAGIPVYIADSPSELARLCGVKTCTVSHSVALMREDPNRKQRYVSVTTEWGDKEYEKYFGRKT